MIDYIVYFQEYNKTDVIYKMLITILSRSTNDVGYFLMLDRRGTIKKRLTKKLVKELIEGYNKLDNFISIGTVGLITVGDIHEELFDGKGNKEGRIRELEEEGNPEFEIFKYYEF